MIDDYYEGGVLHICQVYQQESRQCKQQERGEVLGRIIDFLMFFSAHQNKQAIGKGEREKDCTKVDINWCE